MRIKSKELRKIGSLFIATLIGAGCGSNGGGTPSCTASAPVVSGANVMAVTVNGSQCSGGGANYLNEPCVSVTICSPGTNNCQTINNILLDTGSYGLRIFSSVISPSVPLTQELFGGNSVVECAQFGSGNTWGPVQIADVYLAGEGVISSLPIQTINANYNTSWIDNASQSSIPCSGLSNRDQSPSSAGYNGILGVGLFQNDCASCSTLTSPNAYFTCTGPTCAASTMANNLQVQNPISTLTTDKNGVILELPSLPAACAVSGAQSLNGYLVMGIGTQSNNAVSGVTYFPANGAGDFTVTYSGTPYTGFIDSGSNGLFFKGGSLGNCGSPYSQWFCPTVGNFTGSATNKGFGGSPTGVVNFQISPATSLFNTGNNVFVNLGGNMNTIFDWGLPFYFGRNVYSTINGLTTTLGTSPGWAY